MPHTWEPWVLQPTAGHETHGQSVVYGPDGKSIALVYDGDANGPIIAQAPALLAACKGAEAYLRLTGQSTPYVGAGPQTVYTELVRAIRAAEGE